MKINADKSDFFGVRLKLSFRSEKFSTNNYL